MIQHISNIILMTSIFMLMGMGFALIFLVARFFHFAHAVIFTSGAYFTFLFLEVVEIPLWFSFVLGVILSAVLCCAVEITIYLPLKKKGSNQLVLLLASLGVYIVLQNIISIVFGDVTKSIRKVVAQEGINVFGARITPIQIATICVSSGLVISLSIFLKKTKIGSVMRAVANDPELSSISGINPNHIILGAFAIGSALAGLAGILVALDVDMTPTMGMNALMMGIVAMIIGGVNSISGIALGALLLAMAQYLGAWYIGSQWQNAIAFVILVLFLLFKPEGFFGKKNKTSTV